MPSQSEIATDRKPTAVRILDAAERRFAEQGYRGARLSEISDEVGIRGPSLFNHFKSKRELYEAVLERLLEPFFGMLADLHTDDRQGVGEQHALRRIFEHHARHPHLALILQHAVMSGDEQFDLIVERWYERFFASLDLLHGEQAAADPQAASSATVAMAFNAMILGYVTLAPLHARLLSLEPLAEERIAAFGGLLEALRGALVDERGN